MARRAGSKNELIECEYCGEKYSATYRHCPFCNEDGTGRWDDPDSFEEDYDVPKEKGGKRLAHGGGRPSRRGGGGSGEIPVGRVIWGVLSLALIIAAVCIVVSTVRSLVGKPVDPDVKASAGIESTTPSAVPSQSQPVESQPVGSEAPRPSPSAAVPAVQGTTPTGFTLNRDDFTLFSAGEVFQMEVSFTPAGAKGEVVWKSSDPNVASVSWNGMVTAVAPGTATITATVEGAGEKKCTVRCTFQSGASTPSSRPAASELSLSREDFTLSRAGESWRLTVSGTSSAVTWASSNSAVATVSGDGTVTAVAKGTCQVTATVDGVTLKCIVRCSF